MRNQHAQQIARLLNQNNRLTVPYDAEAISRRDADFLFELDGDEVVGCVEIKKVQWYQWEISHLSVAENEQGKGYGTQLIGRAEEKARAGRARIVQCTIRAGNEASERVFRKCGYVPVSIFFNADSECEVRVWQKVVSRKP